jgi:ferritin-like metal-binding protein YciE
MSSDTLQQQLIKYLADAHSIEEQALQQLKKAPDIAGDPTIATAFSEHLAEPERHESLTRERLEGLGASPSTFKDLVMKVGGEGFVWFARSQPDSTGKLVNHAYSYEALELGSYEMLLRVAMRAGDHETARIAREIRDDEREMRDRLGASFDQSVAASLREQDPDDMEKQLVKYLADAHALENQAIGLLESGPKMVEVPEFEQVMAQHLVETRDHQRMVEARLEAHGESPSKLKDVAMKAGALNWGGFFAAHPDTPGKLNVFAFAFEHLEIAGYEQLKRVAERAGDSETVQVAESILAEERAAAAKLESLFDQTCQASLEAVGVETTA